MIGVKIIFVKDTTNPAGPDVPSGWLGSLTPHVYVDGRPMGMLRSFRLEQDAEIGRPTIHMARLMYGPGDEILTMTLEEFEKWKSAEGLA